MNAYTISGLIGLILAFAAVMLLSIRTRLTRSHLVYLVICAVCGVFAGGHLLYFIVGLPDFIKNDIPYIHSIPDFFDRAYYAASGMVFYGGLLCALLFMFIYIRVRKLPARLYLNNTVIAFPLFHCLGRVGCSFTGCCYGIEYHGSLAIHYSAAHINPGISDHVADFPRFPVQPLEAVLELLIFTVLLILFLKMGDRLAVTPVYLISYAVVRFLDEFLRGDEIRGFLGPFSTSQWISIAVFVITVIYLIASRRKRALPQGAQTQQV